MKQTVNNVSQVFGTTFRLSLLASVMLLGMTGCSDGDEVGDGTVVNTVPLPLDNALTLYCPDAGIADEMCILNDPENPYARVAVNDVTKFELATESPTPKSDFYLWGTAQAKSPRGENQYYTAFALHRMYTLGGSELAREQAKRAYRSVLDNYFGSVTFYVIDTPEGDIAIPQPLRELVAENMFLPSNQNLLPLYDNDAAVLEAFGQWGYSLNPLTGIISKNY